MALHAIKEMTQVLEEIQNAIDLLGLNSSVKKLDDQQTEHLYKQLLAEFVEGGDRRWWWEAFSKPSSSIVFSDGKGFERLNQIVPNPKEVVWFMVEDDQLPYYPIFELTTENAVKIIAECFAFEYYLIPKTKNWLVCENHHDYVIGIGSAVTEVIANGLPILWWTPL